MSNLPLHLAEFVFTARDRLSLQGYCRLLAALYETHDRATTPRVVSTPLWKDDSSLNHEYMTLEVRARDGSFLGHICIERLRGGVRSNPTVPSERPPPPPPPDLPSQASPTPPELPSRASPLPPPPSRASPLSPPPDLPSQASPMPYPRRYPTLVMRLVNEPSPLQLQRVPSPSDFPPLPSRSGHAHSQPKQPRPLPIPPALKNPSPERQETFLSGLFSTFRTHNAFDTVSIRQTLPRNKADIAIETVTFGDETPVYLCYVCLLALSLSSNEKAYKLLSTNCYWFAGMLMSLLEAEYRVRAERLTTSVSAGTWKSAICTYNSEDPRVLREIQEDFRRLAIQFDQYVCSQRSSCFFVHLTMNTSDWIQKSTPIGIR